MCSHLLFHDQIFLTFPPHPGNMKTTQIFKEQRETAVELQCVCPNRHGSWEL